LLTVRTLGDTYMFSAVYLGNRKIKILNNLFLEYHSNIFLFDFEFGVVDEVNKAL